MTKNGARKFKLFIRCAMHAASITKPQENSKYNYTGKNSIVKIWDNIPENQGLRI